MQEKITIPYMTTADAARSLGVSPGALASQMTHGRIGFVWSTGDRPVRMIPVEAVEAYRRDVARHRLALVPGSLHSDPPGAIR